MEIKYLVQRQRAFFRKGYTKEYAFRIQALNRLEHEIIHAEEEIEKALKQDLYKSSFEAYMTEIGTTLEELRYVKKHLKGWMKDKLVSTPLAQFPGKSFEVKEPYGVVLCMAPWNYPFMLCMQPFIGAIAAGNCCVLKPSAYAPRTSAVLKKIIARIFPAEFAVVVEGGREENEELLKQRFDYIFFTGSVSVGKLVMEKAASYLTPVSLELGGKSPCIVDETADLKLAAKRLAFGKYLNSGQTCVAPDYLLIQESVKDEFLHHLKYWIIQMYGEEPLKNPDYSRMVNEKHYKRVMELLKGEHVAAGGYGSRETLQIAPTVLDLVKAEAPVMQEEIFGPVLPVLTFKRPVEAIRFVENREKPLAVYLFTKSKKMERCVLKYLSFGGGCINDTIIHLANSRLGFGGIGNSGMGSYHGKYSFDTFSHRKSIVKKYGIDLPVRYQPYSLRKERLLRMFM